MPAAPSSPAAPGKARSGFLCRLASDTRGNTLGVMAIAMIPLAAMAGSAIDTTRMYVVKGRLQQACDAGVLAGRKFMTSDGGTTLDANSEARAQEFFANNFKNGWFGTSDASFTPSRTDDNQVAGRATTIVPMTLMKMFQQTPATLTVTCEARFDVADVDTLLVLDTTGSMNCAPNEASCTMTNTTYPRPGGGTGYSYVEKPTSKIVALRRAVLAYYDTLVTNADPTTNLRFGFVNYASTVNVGAAIRSVDPSYLVDSWTYQSRRWTGNDTAQSTNDRNVNNVTQATCNSYLVRTPASGYRTNDDRAVVTSLRGWARNTGQPADATGLGQCQLRDTTVSPQYNYAPATSDVSRFKMGDAVLDPSKVNAGTNVWQGCIEERLTTATNSFDPDNLPADLDPDIVPTSDDTRWRPMWPEQIYDRQSFTTFISGSEGYETRNVGVDVAKLSGGFAMCGKPAQRLAEMARADVEAYVNAVDFRALGGTYHDAGMIWGARLISPTGIFANDTAAWPGRNPPNRHIIFMTDGDMAPNMNVYGLYGVEVMDRRVTGNGATTIHTSRHNTRFLAACDAAKARNITVWVVAFGQAMTTELRNCATTPAQAFFVGTNAELETRFRAIAAQIAMLRVSR